VSEWVDGREFDEVKALDQDQRDRFGEIVYRFYYGSIQHLGAYNADPHPGNYLLLDDGRVAFLDYGSVKEMPRERVELMGDYSLAAAAGDAERAKVLLGELGYLPDPDKLTADRLLETVLDTKGWFLEDREIRIDPPYVAHLIATLPTDDVMIGRLDAGVVAVMGQLRAKRNWYRIFREWWLWPDEPPATELGELEHTFFAA
jgi:hypothetical protein